LRRPTWPRPGSRLCNTPSAPIVLEELSRRIADNAPDALRRRMDVAFAQPERGGYAPSPLGDRAWRVAQTGSNLWCIVGFESQAALLEAVLGGPGAARPTSIERAIVAETMERLFLHMDSPESQLAECENERPLHEPWWRCNVDLTPRKGRSATLQLFAPPGTADRSNSIAGNAGDAPDVHSVPLSLSVELAPVAITLSHILGWQPGAIVPLPRGSLGGVTICAKPDVALARGRAGATSDEAGCAVRAFEITSVQSGDAA